MKLENLNFTLPEGTTNHGNPHLLCFPTRWNDIAVFILGNYVAHATTVKTPPASSPIATAWFMLGSLLVPSTGLAFGMLAIYQARKGFKQSSLRKATLARALCMYVRADDWYIRSCSSSQTVQVKATVNTSPFQENRLTIWRLFHAVSRQGSSVMWSLPALFRLQQSERIQPVSEDVLSSDRYVQEHVYLPDLLLIISSASTVVGQSGSQQPIETAVIYTTQAVLPSLSADPGPLREKILDNSRVPVFSS
ncbi:hypothetical protein X797_010475 [Metarhizium robertsii]|uniref:Uncharacterized protein n=1 Tax=Metarhizium robertsii TaxID=568076 RepID=A0A0A1UNU3_9HYPO|nr:hypothetical protein X797_010475 [Metarhizium robertsii]